MGTRHKTQCALLWLKKCSQLLFVNLKLFEKLEVEVERRNIQRQGKKSWFHTTCLVASLGLHTHNCSLPVMPISPSLPLLPLLESTSLVYFCTETIIDASVLLGLWEEKDHFLLPLFWWSSQKISLPNNYENRGYFRNETSEAQPESPLDSAQKLNIRENWVVHWKSSS
jgi:hypothetical protein